jgi:hypothetical protein
MSREINICGSVVCCCLLLSSCAGLGTRVEILKPESVGSIRRVGLAPILVDDHTLSVCHGAEAVVREALTEQIAHSGVFEVVSADRLLARADKDGLLPCCGVPLDVQTLLIAADSLQLDGVLFCKLSAYEAEETTTEKTGDWGLSFDESGTHVTREEKNVTKVNWIGAKVSLQIVESSTGELVFSSVFDTFKGKTYTWTLPPPEGQIADAVEGAYRPLAKAWAE